MEHIQPALFGSLALHSKSLNKRLSFLWLAEIVTYRIYNETACISTQISSYLLLQKVSASGLIKLISCCLTPMIAANAIRTKIKIIPRNTNASLNFVQGAACSLFDDEECCWILLKHDKISKRYILEQRYSADHPYPTKNETAVPLLLRYWIPACNFAVYCQLVSKPRFVEGLPNARITDPQMNWTEFYWCLWSRRTHENFHREFCFIFVTWNCISLIILQNDFMENDGSIKIYNPITKGLLGISLSEKYRFPLNTWFKSYWTVYYSWYFIRFNIMVDYYRHQDYDNKE